MAVERPCDALSPGTLDTELARLLWLSGAALDYSGSRGGMLALKREMELRGYRFLTAAGAPGRGACCAFHPEGAPRETARWVGTDGLPEALAVSRAALLALRAGPT
jgi:hypothetical protein